MHVIFLSEFNAKLTKGLGCVLWQAVKSDLMFSSNFFFFPRSCVIFFPSVICAERHFICFMIFAAQRDWSKRLEYKDSKTLSVHKVEHDGDTLVPAKLNST